MKVVPEMRACALNLISTTLVNPIIGMTPVKVPNVTPALDSQPQAIKITSCLPIADGSLWVLRLLQPLKLDAMILLKVALSTINLKVVPEMRACALNLISTFLFLPTYLTPQCFSSCSD
jgi:hypothetical protein